MVSGLFNIHLECLLQVWVPVQIASSLVGSNWFGTLWVSSLEETPSEPVILGSLLGCAVWSYDDITVSSEIALSHFIVHVDHAVLVSLLSVSELLPVSLGSFDFVSCQSLLEIGISIEIALSFLVVNMSLEHIVVTLFLDGVTFVGIILSLFLTLVFVETGAFRIVVWV